MLLRSWWLTANFKWSDDIFQSFKNYVCCKMCIKIKHDNDMLDLSLSHVLDQSWTGGRGVSHTAQVTTPRPPPVTSPVGLGFKTCNRQNQADVDQPLMWRKKCFLISWRLIMIYLRVHGRLTPIPLSACGNHSFRCKWVYICQFWPFWGGGWVTLVKVLW